ncbi:MAG: L,D-transpeptidase family protein [Acidobacteriota bacterium]|nr:L,D-transpeptidase family protein [Acidobacteriota bacterium]
MKALYRVLLTLVLTNVPLGISATERVGEAIRRQLEYAGEPAAIHIGDDVVYASHALPAFYERRGFAPAWSSAGRFERRARKLLETIREVEAEGLRPSDYHLDALVAGLEASAPGVEDLAATDLLLTDAFLILAAHIVSGRVDPATFEPEWIATRREVDVAALLEDVVAGDGVRKTLRELRPDHAGYERLVKALSRYREIASRGGWPLIGPGPSLKPGTTDPAVAVLRRRLTIAGDYRGGEAAEPDRYDDSLVEATVRFQQRHGLEDDGVVGPKTREALDVSAARRARLIELNLERWRWLPQELGDRYILVNVPGFDLRVSESGEEVLAMRVVVGRAMRRTPVFSDVMRYLVFSPSWEVPPTILRLDKLPEIRKNPNYAIEQNFRVFQLGDGRWTEVNPLEVEWSRATAATIRLRQRPGPNNALGLAKFMFPNAFNVYLHDTPSRELFARSQRDFSSGCVRVEKPAELAYYLLHDDPAWTREAVVAAMESGQERSVTLPRPIAVHIEYWTAWVEAGGVVQFRRDIYGRDARLDAALKLPPPSEPEE